MKTLFVIPVFLFVSALSISAQEVITTSGGEGSGDGGTVSYSVGQISYTTMESQDGIITEGVQQPYEIFVIVGIDEAEDITVFCQAYPNPTTGNLSLKVESYNSENLSYQLIDFNGRVITNDKVEGAITSIDMTNLPPSTYFLKVLDGNRKIKTFKIIKR